jgi:5-methylcytosine-specific restriction endonuclease McrA
LSFFGNTSGNNSKGKNREKYKELTLAIKQIVLERSKNRCQNCSKKLSGSTQPQFYHINGSKKDNRPENLRVLCLECYEDKVPKTNNNMMFSSLKNIFSKK